MPTPLDYNIRRLGSDDVTVFRILTALFGRVFEEQEAYGGNPPDDAYLTRWLSHDGHIALVAEVEGRPVGGLVAFVWDKFERAGREIYIYDLAVEPDCQRCGIESALIDATREIAKQCNVTIIYIQAESDNAPAIATYKTCAAREDIAHFEFQP